MSFHVHLPILALFPLLCAHAAANAPAARRLGPPQMMKLDWGVDSVAATDLDGDGRTDLAALNNETARVEVLLRLKPGEAPPAPRTLRADRWNPTLDDAPFRRLSIAGAPDMGSLALADLDGDKRADIVFTSSREPLTIISRDKSGEWSQRRVFRTHDAMPGNRTLVAADLDGNGTKELLMLAKSGLLVFPKFPADGNIPEPKLYRLGVDNPEGLAVTDIDGDGRLDVAYRTRGEKPELRVRFGLSTGGFGPERAFRTEYSSVTLDSRVPVGVDPAPAAFVGVSLRKRAVEFFAVRADERAFREADAVSPALYAPASAVKSASLAALADIDGDGRAALLVGDARGAALRVFRAGPSGDFGEPVDYPAPANLSALAAAKFDGKKVSLLLLGEKDGTLGHAVFDAKGRPGFPSEVKLDGTPVAVAAADVDGDGRAEALVVVKGDKADKAERKSPPMSLITLAFDDASGEFKVKASVALDSGAKDATGLAVGDFGGDAKPDLVVLTERDPALLLLNRGAGKFEPVAKDSSVRKGMLSGASAADLGFGDVDGDGLTELLVSAPGFVRSLRVDAKGDLVVKDQFNARRPGDRLKCPAAVKLDAAPDAKPGLLAYNDTDKGLEWLAPDDAGVFRHRRTIETGALDPLGLVAEPASRDGATPARLVHAGRDRVAVTDLTRAGLRLAVLDRFESDLPGIVHSVAEVGRFTGGATPDLALIDPRNHHLELVRRTGDGAWTSSLHWSLFDENQFYRGRRNAGAEPHDGLSADLDGDGFSELVLLMHDRLLVYPSVPAETGTKQ